MSQTTPLAIPPVPTIEDDEEDVIHQDDTFKDLTGITELVKIDPERVDGVETPANGFPILLLKSTGNTPTGGSVMADATNQAGPGPGVNNEGAAPVEDATKTAQEGTGGTPEPAADTETAGKEALEKASAAYQQALREHRAAEPSVKDAVDPTDVLKARAAWDKWNRTGKDEGLDGSPEGRDQWITKAMGMGSAAPPPPSAAATGVGAGMKSDPDDDKDDDGEEMGDSDAEKSKLTAEQRHNIPQSDFAYVDSKGEGHLPVHDKGHVHSALGRFAQQHFETAEDKKKAARKILSRARSMGVDVDSDATVAEHAKALKSAAGDETMPEGMVKCPTCGGSKKIRDGGMDCPKCKGKGYVKPGKKARKAALDATVETLEKTVAAGLLSRAAADQLIAEARAIAGLDDVGKERGLPADTHPAGAHREPDGSSTVEQLEPDAGLPTDRDSTPDKVPASVSALTMKDVPYTVLRMHDALCAAYAVKDVTDSYPSLVKVTDAVSPKWFADQAQARLAAGETRKGAGLADLAATAETLLGLDADAVTDARALMAKAMTDQYPNIRIRPADPRSPSQFHRGYLSTGHARENAPGAEHPDIPPSTRTPEPQDYQRGYLTGGHAAPSPGDHSPNMPAGAGHSGHEYYTTAEQQMAADAMRSLHDHIASTFAGACPMAPTKAPMPLNLGADSTPSTKKPPANMGGIATVKATSDDGTPAAHQDPPDGPAKKKDGKMRASDITAAVKAAFTELQPASAPLTAQDIQTLLDTKVAEVTGRYETQIADLRKQVDELGAQPDPNMAPVRGQLARQPGDTGKPAPVEKRSLMDEARDAKTAQRARLTAYLAKQAESPDPKLRHAAEAVIERMEASDAA